MQNSRRPRLGLPHLVFALSLGACVGAAGLPAATGSGAAGAGATGTASTGGQGGSGLGSGSGGVDVAVPSDNPLLPARIRRLTNAEYDASVQALLATSKTYAQTAFPRDARQNNFTVNDAQRVDPVLAKQLSDTAISLVAEARASGKLASLSPCANPTAGGEACATTFIQTFGARVYRRPLVAAESAAMVTIYHAGADGAAYNDGIDAVVRALLQSAGFLYVSEIGDGNVAPAAAGDGVVTLTASEVASVLSYLVTGAPPDDALVAAAATLPGGADAREQQVRRLLATPAGKAGLVRVIREWLGIDQIDQTAKDSTVYGSFGGLRNSISAESVNFVDEVVNRSTGTVGELLGADWTIADSSLATFYGVTSAGTGKTSLASVGRRGILNQAAFLSVFAHASESAPILRGVAVMKRLACITVVSPLTLNIVVTPPVPDPNKTTRERYAIHATDKVCAGCHTNIDAFGFAFEGYDGMGAARPLSAGVLTENGHPTDASTTIPAGPDFAGPFASSNALATALSTSTDVRTCMARQMFHSFAARGDVSVRGSEENFVAFWKALPPDKQGNFVETLVAYVRNASFVQRRVKS
jgi:hypothetical protein